MKLYDTLVKEDTVKRYSVVLRALVNVTTYK